MKDKRPMVSLLVTGRDLTTFSEASFRIERLSAIAHFIFLVSKTTVFFYNICLIILWPIQG